MKIVKADKRFYNPAFLFLIIALLLIVFAQPWTGTYYNSLISWDKLGYYLYLPTAFIYKDWLSFKFIPEYFNHYQPCSYWYQTITLPSGNQVISYPIGIAIVQLPFFALGYISAWLFNYKLDGFSEPFVFWTYISGLVFGLIGVYYSYKSLCYYFTTKLSYVVLVLLFAGTNIFYYCFLDSIMPHSYLFGLYSVLIYNTIRWHQSPKFLYLFIICISIGLMISIRATELIAVIIPLLWGVNGFKSLKEKLILLNEYKIHLILSVVIGSIPFVLQMIYWKYSTGHFVFNPYAFYNLGFSWSKPHILDFLFSFRKGWLMYTPLMGLSFFGFWILIKESRYKDFALGFVIFIVINIYILCSWGLWWYGGSYGQRPMVQSYAVFIFAIAALLDWIKKYTALSYLVYSYIGFCLLLNISFTWQYADGRMGSDGITKGMFKELLLNPDFGNIKKSDPSDVSWKNDFVKKKTILYSYDIAKDTIAEIDSSEKAIVIRPNSYTNLYELNSDSALNIPYKWIRCSFEMKHSDVEPLWLNNLSLISSVEGCEGDTRSWVAKSFNTLYRGKNDMNVWKGCVADFEVPATFRSCDKLRFCFWMSSSESALIRNMKVYSLELK